MLTYAHGHRDKRVETAAKNFWARHSDAFKDGELWVGTGWKENGYGKGGLVRFVGWRVKMGRKNYGSFIICKTFPRGALARSVLKTLHEHMVKSMRAVVGR